jgi:formamidopyrimidine-DNA glycosylase
MPELPEVETTVRALRSRLLGQQLREFEASWPPMVLPSVAEVRSAVVGQRVAAVDRRGKFVVLRLQTGACLVHLKMTGRLLWSDNGAPVAHVRASWTLSDGDRLLFRDPRKFGRVRYVSDYEQFAGQLGIEPLTRAFTPDALRQVLRARRRLKPLLLDQTQIAGLGNIYADEALFRARLHPLRPACSVNPAQAAALHQAIRSVLREAIRHGGSSIDWAYPGGRMQNRLAVYGRAGQPCPRCGRAIVRIRVGGRGTHVCPRCQKAPYPRSGSNGV